MAELAECVRSGRIKLVTTDLAAREVEARIQREVAAAAEAAKRFRSKARILRNVNAPSFANIFEEFDEVSVAKHLIKQWRRYVSGCNTEVVLVDSVAPSEVFESYFAARAPFGPSAKRKHEFPDAFTLAALEKWANSQEATVVVVSRDEGVREAAASSVVLHPVEHVEELLEQVVGAKSEMIGRVRSGLEAQFPDIETKLSELFEWSGFYLADQDGDVIEVTVTSIYGPEMYVIRLGTQTVRFELRATVQFKASISYDDLSTATWDSEDKRYFVHHTIEKDVEREHEIVAYGEARLQTEDGSELEVTSLMLYDSDYAVEAEVWEDYR